MKTNFSSNPARAQSWIALFIVPLILLVATDQSAFSQDTAECVASEVTFDGTIPLAYRVAKADAQQRVDLYREYPGGCEDSTQGRCRPIGYLIKGDIAAVAKSCGAWSYLQYIGEKKITVGWAEANRFSDLLREGGASEENVKSEEENSTAYRFRLTKGNGIPVCEAYLQRLNRTNFSKPDPFRRVGSPPYCGRPENDSVPGFSVLKREMLTPATVQRLIAKIWNFTHPNLKKPECYVRDVGGPCVETWPIAEIKEELSPVSEKLFAWRYPGGVDIENNRHPEEIVIWQGIGVAGESGLCGVVYGDSPDAGYRQPQLAYVLTKNDADVDQERTKALFQHPVRDYVGTRQDGERFVISDRYRPIGTSTGIFEYRNKVYLDTFFDVWGDLRNARVDLPKIANTLAVIERKGGEAKEICEYEVSGQDYPTHKTWSLSP